MAKHTIAFPEVETYFILKKVDLQTTPNGYGSVLPNQTMDSLIDKMKDYVDFSKWQTELAKDGIIVELDDEGNWYVLE